MENEYFECASCGQVVQGWNASQMIDCCEEKHMMPVCCPSHLPEVEAYLAANEWLDSQGCPKSITHGAIHNLVYRVRVALGGRQ